MNHEDIERVRSKTTPLDEAVGSLNLRSTTEGNTVGARLNRMISCYSMSSLIACGNHRISNNRPCDMGTNNCGVCICTNRMDLQRVYPNLSKVYKKAYIGWMDRAVACFIERIDAMSDPNILFRNTNDIVDLHFDLTLRGGEGGCTSKLTRVRVAPMPGMDSLFEFVFDTVYHDDGVFEGT